MAFSEAEKEQIRYYTGYGMLGSQALPAGGYRFFETYGTLEYKMINCQPGEEDEIRNNYLVKLPVLRDDIYGVRANSDTAQAAVWFRNKDELKERRQLYKYFRLELVNFMGLTPGPNLGGGISFVV